MWTSSRSCRGHMLLIMVMKFSQLFKKRGAAFRVHWVQPDARSAGIHTPGTRQQRRKKRCAEHVAETALRATAQKFSAPPGNSCDLCNGQDQGWPSRGRTEVSVHKLHNCRDCLEGHSTEVQRSTWEQL